MCVCVCVCVCVYVCVCTSRHGDSSLFVLFFVETCDD